MTRFFKVHLGKYAFAWITGITLIISCHKNNLQDKQPELPATTSSLNSRAAFLNTSSVGSLQVITIPNVFIYNMAAVVSDTDGTIYAADSTGNFIWKVRPGNTPTIFAGAVGAPGFTDGRGTAARFNKPIGIAIDAGGNLYVADKSNHAIRKITRDSLVTTLAGTGFAGTTEGPRLSAQFNLPSGVAVDAAGNVYVADAGNNKIRKIRSDTVSTFAGNGTQGHSDDVNGLAQFYNPAGVAVNNAGTTVYVADAGNNKIRVIAGGETNTLAGGGVNGDTPGFSEGTGSGALFNKPIGVTVDANQNVYVADKNNNRIRQVTPAGSVSTLAGTGVADYLDGIPSVARFNGPTSVFVNSAGYIFVADAGNIRVREIGLITQVTTVAGSGIQGEIDGPPGSAQFYFPNSITADGAGNIYVTDGYTELRKISMYGTVTTPAGSSQGGYADGTGSFAKFSLPGAIATDAAGNIYVADTWNHRIRKVTPAGVVTTIAGSGPIFSWFGPSGGYVDGPGYQAMFSSPMSLVLDNAGNIYVGDGGNSRIRKITPDGNVSTFSGSGTYGSADGSATTAQFGGLSRMAMDASGNIYVSDMYTGRLRKVTPDGSVTTIAGGSTSGYRDGPLASALFAGISGIAIDAEGNLFVADISNNRIRKISNGIVTTVAGSGPVGYGTGAWIDGPGNFARFNGPGDICIGPSGALYVSDYYNNRIRKIQ